MTLLQEASREFGREGTWCVRGGWGEVGGEAGQGRVVGGGSGGTGNKEPRLIHC